MTAARNDFLAEEHGPLTARSGDGRLAPAVDDDTWSDYPWVERNPSAAAQRRETAVWIEEILAEVDRRR